MAKIGFQGIVGSNAEEAAKLFVEKNKKSKHIISDLLENVEFIPCITSQNTITSLKNGNIDYAVVATKNTLGGTVEETFQAINQEYLMFMGTEILPIHHCLFKKKGVELSKIDTVCSHPQALIQTEITRERYFPDMEEFSYADTALAAENLANNILPDNYAVICRKNAGLSFGLELIQENIEDSKDNYTEFRIYKTTNIAYDNDEKPSFKEWLTYQFASEDGLSYIAKVIMIIGMFIAIIVTREFNMNAFEAAIMVGGYTTFVILFFTSNKFRSSRRFDQLTGYWKYYSISDKRKEKDFREQNLDTPRIVKIEEVDNKLKFSGFICNAQNRPFFESKEDILISSIGKKKGNLMYFYGKPNIVQSGINIGGIAHLKWTSKYAASKINRMDGGYYGTVSRDTGSLTYLRITKEEYETFRNSMFL